MEYLSCQKRYVGSSFVSYAVGGEWLQNIFYFCFRRIDVLLLVLFFNKRCYIEAGSSVGIASDYGLDGPGSNPDWDEIFRPSRPGPGAHPASCTVQWVPGLCRG